MTRQQAINEMCKQCIYDPDGDEGGVRQQIEACTSKSCPLYNYRPIPDPRWSKSLEKHA